MKMRRRIAESARLKRLRDDRINITFVQKRLRVIVSFKLKQRIGIFFHVFRGNGEDHIRIHALRPVPLVIPDKIKIRRPPVFFSVDGINRVILRIHPHPHAFFFIVLRVHINSIVILRHRDRKPERADDFKKFTDRSFFGQQDLLRPDDLCA